MYFYCISYFFKFKSYCPLQSNSNNKNKNEINIMKKYVSNSKYLRFTATYNIVSVKHTCEVFMDSNFNYAT